VTLTISEQDYANLWQEKSLHQGSHNPAEVVEQCPQELGTGCRRWVTLRGIDLLIHDYEFHKDIQVQYSGGNDECLEFGFQLQGGSYTERQAGQNFVQTGLHDVDLVCERSHERILQVDIHLESVDDLRSFTPNDLEQSPLIQKLIKAPGKYPYTQIGEKLDTQQGPDRGGPFDLEESWQLEVGAKTSLLSDRLTATLAFYYIVRENLLVTDPADSNRLLQLGEARSQGIELEVVGQLTDNWSLIASYVLNDAEVTEDTNALLVGRQLENAPRHTAALWTRYSIPNTGFGIAGGLTFVDERQTFSDTVQLPSYIVLDAALYYAFREVELALNFDNILDKTYFIGGYDETAVFPGSPFTVRFTASYRF